METVQAFRTVQKKHDGLTNKAKQVQKSHEDVIFKRFKEGVDAANKELAIETKKVRELSQITGSTFLKRAQVGELFSRNALKFKCFN